MSEEGQTKELHIQVFGMYFFILFTYLNNMWHVI